MKAILPLHRRVGPRDGTVGMGGEYRFRGVYLIAAANGWQERPPAKRCGSCSSRWVPWRGRHLKVASLPVTLVKLRHQQHG